MVNQLPYCPHCGAQQLKANTRFCHICGQPIPTAPAAAARPVALPPRRARRLSAWWSLPLLIAGVAALAFLVWEPARGRVNDFLADIRTEPTEIMPPTSARSAPGDATVGPTQIASLAPTATPTASATGAASPSATPRPTVTLRPTSTPTATSRPSDTPTAGAAAMEFLAVSLQGFVNARTMDGYVAPPVGDVVLGGVRFSLGQGGSVTTQAAPLPDNPTSISLAVDSQSPQTVYLLITGGDLYNRFAGQTVGRVRLVFSDGKAHAIDLVAGQNLREWKQSGDVVSRTTSSDVTEAWRGANRDDESTAVIDMLRIPIPSGLQAGRLVSIEVVDLSAETVGDLDPALNVLGVSVALKPEPTSTPTAQACRIATGGPFRSLWQQQRARLGCPLNQATQTSAATERFERGRMIWRENNDMIYVLNDDGEWAAYADIYVEGAPEPDGFQPPAGLYTPVRGFGAIWRAKPGGISARIGWATQDEYAVSVLCQDFEKGLMLEMEGKVYLLGDRGGRWQAP